MGGRLNLTKLKGYVDLRTMGGQMIRKNVTDRRGDSTKDEVHISTMGGNIRIDSVDGTVQATTMAGDIDITMVGDPEKGQRDIKLKSMRGDVALTVPPSLSMNLDITLAYTKESSRDYKIVSEFPIQMEETKEWDHSQGSARKYIYGTGTIAGGKNKLKIETINGDVYLKKGSKYGSLQSGL
jgi:DUF4097 and DUF4098 domain-containing protein YvlB